MVVPGNFPIGCLPVYLTAFKTNNRTATYDEFNCLKDLNDFAEYFNERLQHAIKELRNENPDTVILYADYYNAFQWLFRNVLFLGKSLHLYSLVRSFMSHPNLLGESP